MTTTPAQDGQRAAPEDQHADAIAVPLSILLGAAVAVALAYGVISTLSKVVQLFS